MKIGHCEFPDDLYYDVERGTLRVGVTSLLSWSSGLFSSVTFKDAGTEVSADEVVGSVEGSRRFEVIRSPVSGTVLRHNPALAGSPSLLNKDPYGEGWFVEMRVGSEDGLRSLQRLPAAESSISRAIEERGVRCFAAFPDYEMFDGGVECAATITKLNELLGNSEPDCVVHVISDDPLADVEMVRWSEQTGNLLLESRRAGKYNHFIVRKSPQPRTG